MKGVTLPTYPRSPDAQRASLLLLIGAGLQATGRIQDGEAIVEAGALLDGYVAVAPRRGWE